MRSPVTIRDVARHANVSAATVSNVLSGKRPIGAEVSQRVIDIVKQLGYRPNPAARTLSLKKSMQVGVLVSDVTNSCTGQLLKAISEQLRKNGYNILLGTCEGEKETAINYLHDFSSGMTDGVINMVDKISANEAAYECNGVPVVTYLRPGVSPVCVDMIGSSMSAMEHLWSLGHRRIGFISSPSASIEVQLEGRELGYRQFFTMRNLELDEFMIARGDDTPEGGYAGAEQLSRVGVTAIFAANDMMAVGVLQWAHEKGIKVPQSLSVIGFDDAPVARAVAPPLTTLQFPVAALAEKTVNGLLMLMKGQTWGQTEILSAKLVVRNSTTHVSMRHNIKKCLQVN